MNFNITKENNNFSVKIKMVFILSLVFLQRYEYGCLLYLIFVMYIRTGIISFKLNNMHNIILLH